ncbi:MAG: hypothetical protein HFE73_04925, partial [Firmicutes bacterium]|nr:hypothetical protein [Bacillota bacterium]
DSDKKLLDVVKRTYKTVNYQESNSNWARVSINDKFFLFSNAEIHGNDIYHKFTFSDEDTQYDFFKTDTNKIVNYYNEKGLDAGPSVWGLRSPYYGNTDSSISYNGINTVGSVIPISYRSSSMFVFGFCI